MKILSISDVITNSSSEVFVIHSKPEFQEQINEEIPELLKEMCDLVGLDIYDIMSFEVAEESEIDSDWQYYTAKRDLLINSCSDNSIPDWLMRFIEDLPYLPKFEDKFSGYYAEDLGKKEIPYYDWETKSYKISLQEIESIQRVHLG